MILQVSEAKIAAVERQYEAQMAEIENRYRSQATEKLYRLETRVKDLEKMLEVETVVWAVSVFGTVSAESFSVFCQIVCIETVVVVFGARVTPLCTSI